MTVGQPESDKWQRRTTAVRIAIHCALVGYNAGDSLTGRSDSVSGRGTSAVASVRTCPARANRPTSRITSADLQAARQHHEPTHPRSKPAGRRALRSLTFCLSAFQLLAAIVSARSRTDFCVLIVNAFARVGRRYKHAVSVYTLSSGVN